MAEETYLSWNAANWITILLMAAVGFAALGLLVKTVKARQASNDSN